MKVTQKQFLLFQNYCKAYQQEFGLNHWTLYFRLKKIHSYANNNTDDQYVATITLADEYDKSDIDIAGGINLHLMQTAKHEMLHVIIGKLYFLGWKRDTSSKELLSANEEAVSLLEKII